MFEIKKKISLAYLVVYLSCDQSRNVEMWINYDT